MLEPQLRSFRIVLHTVEDKDTVKVYNDLVALSTSFVIFTQLHTTIALAVHFIGPVTRKSKLKIIFNTESNKAYIQV